MKSSNQFENTYSDYNRIVRTWFVAFGVGTPSALIFSEETRALVKDSEHTEYIMLALAAGAILQIFIALLNKYVAWCNAYISYVSNPENIPRLVSFIASLTHHLWIDLIIDLATYVLFGYAIIKLFDVLI